MAKFSTSSNIISSPASLNDRIIDGYNDCSSSIGPVLGDGAPYSAIGVDELWSLLLRFCQIGMVFFNPVQNQMLTDPFRPMRSVPMQGLLEEFLDPLSSVLMPQTVAQFN